MKTVITHIQINIKKSLPGKDAHVEAAPYRKADFIESELPPHKVSAVLILLFPKGNEWYVALIERSKYDGKHSGQIALPGGKSEPEDLTIIDTALRETEEEIGVNRKLVNVIGELSKVFIPVSNYLVYPVIGYCDIEPQFVPDKKEVESIIEVPLKMILDESAFQSEKVRLSDGMVIKTPAFKWLDYTVWGATAMMMNEFRWMMKNYSKSS